MIPPKMKKKYKKNNSELTEPLLSGEGDSGEEKGNDNESFFNKIIEVLYLCPQFALVTGSGIMGLYDNRLEYIEFIRGLLKKAESIQGNKLRYQELARVLRLIDRRNRFYRRNRSPRVNHKSIRRDRITKILLKNNSLPMRPGLDIKTILKEAKKLRIDLAELYTEVFIKLHEITINALREEMLNISNNQRGYRKDRIFTELTRVAESIKKVAWSLKKGEIIRIRQNQDLFCLVPYATQSQLIELYNETVTRRDEILIDAFREKLDQAQAAENSFRYEELKEVEKLIYGVFSTSESRLCRLSGTQRSQLAELYNEVRTLVDKILIEDVSMMLETINTQLEDSKRHAYTELIRVKDLMDKDMNRHHVDLPSPQWFLRLTRCLPTFFQTPALHFLLLESHSDTRSELAKLYNVTLTIRDKIIIDALLENLDQAKTTKNPFHYYELQKVEKLISGILRTCETPLCRLPYTQRCQVAKLYNEVHTLLDQAFDSNIEAFGPQMNFYSVFSDTKRKDVESNESNVLKQGQRHVRPKKELMNSSLMKRITHEKNLTRDEEFDRSIKHRMITALRSVSNIEGLHDGNGDPNQYSDFKIISTTGDGYCAVYAIALALGAAHGDREDQILVRYKGIVADLDALAPNQFKQLTEGFPNSESRTFNDLFLRWIERKYHIKIDVFRSEGSILQYMNDELERSIDVSLENIVNARFIKEIPNHEPTTTISILNTGASYGQHWSAIEPGQENVLRDLCGNSSENLASELDVPNEEKVEEEESKETNVYVPPSADENREIEGGEVVHTLLPGT